MVDKVTKEDKLESKIFRMEKNRLKFLNFIDYFKTLSRQFPEVQIHGTDGISGNLTLSGTADKIGSIEFRMLLVLMKISNIEVKMSDRQIDFLHRTNCAIVNSELKKYDVMLMLVPTNGAKAWQAEIFSLEKCDSIEATRLRDVVFAKTSERCKKVDRKTARFFTNPDKLQEFRKKLFDKHQVLVDADVTNPGHIWIVCEESKMKNAESELAKLSDETTIKIFIFKPADGMKVRFIKMHCWDKVKDEAEDVSVLEMGSESLAIKGTVARRKVMLTFLQELAQNVVYKEYPLTEPDMIKRINMDRTKAVISEIENDYRCVIERDNNEPEKIKVTKKAIGVTDGAAVTSGTSKMNLPYHCISFVNDKQVEMASGHKITIVVGDLAHQKVDVIVNTTNDSLNLNANSCAKALFKVAGQQLQDECLKVGSLKVGNMVSTGPANLNCKRVYHVLSSQWNNGKGALVLRQLIKKCLQQAEKDRFTSIAIPAIGTGNLQFPREEVAKVFFEEVSSYLMIHPQSTIKDVRFVVYSGDQATVNAFLDDSDKIDKACEELKKKMIESVQEKIMTDKVIKKFTDRDLRKLRKVERTFDFEIKVDQGASEVRFKGHILDMAEVQGKISEILNDIKENRSKVPDYWTDLPANKKFHKVNLATSSKEYKEAEIAFRKTAQNQIVRIERIQNRQIYELYNVKRQAMMRKYGSKFTGKELMLFHGTSSGNIDKINSGGLNRNFGGIHGTAYGRGVYFARDASYSCNPTYSPPDPQGLRYVYYSKVLVGEYTQGDSSMIMPPNKNSSIDPNDTYESVVDNLHNPSIYVLFHDYEYYTEYLITFR